MTPKEMEKLLKDKGVIKTTDYTDEQYVYHSDTITEIFKRGVKEKSPVDTIIEIQQFVGEAIEWHKEHMVCCSNGFFFQEHDCQKKPNTQNPTQTPPEKWSSAAVADLQKEKPGLMFWVKWTDYLEAMRSSRPAPAVKTEEQIAEIIKKAIKENEKELSEIMPYDSWPDNFEKFLIKEFCKPTSPEGQKEKS